MKFTVRILLSVVSAMLLSLSANAATHTVDYVYDGTTLTPNATAAGSTLAVGDTVLGTVHAAGNDYWTALAGDSIWTPVFLNESGVRTGDLRWTYLLDGVTVDTGALLGDKSSAFHIVNLLEPSRNISFDTLTWSYLLTDSTATSNTFRDLYPAGLLTLTPATYVVSSVPEPETSAMLLVGLMTVGAIARRRRA